MSFIPTEIKDRILTMLDVPRKDIPPYDRIYSLRINNKIVNDIISLKQLGYYVFSDYDDIVKNPNIFKTSMVQQTNNFSKNNIAKTEPEWGFANFQSK